MIRRVVLGGMLVTVGFFGSPGQNDAFACNRTAGCAMDVLLEDYGMMRDGRMDKAMKAGRENMEAFRAMQAAQQKSQSQQKGPAGK